MKEEEKDAACILLLVVFFSISVGCWFKDMMAGLSSFFGVLIYLVKDA